MNGHCDIGPQLEAQARLREHKALLATIDLLVIELLIDGSGL
jgi:hypothetical protein